MADRHGQLHRIGVGLERKLRSITCTASLRIRLLPLLFGLLLDVQRLLDQQLLPILNLVVGDSGTAVRGVFGSRGNRIFVLVCGSRVQIVEHFFVGLRLVLRL